MLSTSATSRPRYVTVMVTVGFVLGLSAGSLCLEQDSQKMKWRLALRIATSPSERWLMKAVEWNLELSSKYRTNRAIGRPRQRWEDDVNEFLKFVEDETENFTESSSQINKTWINTAKDSGRWTLLNEKYTMTSQERQDNNARMRMRKIIKVDQRETSTE